MTTPPSLVASRERISNSLSKLAASPAALHLVRGCNDRRGDVSSVSVIAGALSTDQESPLTVAGRSTDTQITASLSAQRGIWIAQSGEIRRVFLSTFGQRSRLTKDKEGVVGERPSPYPSPRVFSYLPSCNCHVEVKVAVSSGTFDSDSGQARRAPVAPVFVSLIETSRMSSPGVRYSAYEPRYLRNLQLRSICHRRDGMIVRPISRDQLAVVR